MKVGVVGNGVVGNAVVQWLKSRGEDVVIYDKYQEENKAFHKILDTDVCFLCLPTPTINKVNDVGAYAEVMEAFSRRNYKGTFIIKGTMLPSSLEALRMKFPSTLIVYSPEFLKEASAVQDMLEQKYVVISGDITQLIRVLFKGLDIHETTENEATMMKYAVNSFLATKVIFFNQLKFLCDKINVDYDKVRNLAMIDDRIGNSHTAFHNKGGFGGMCFPKDTNALYEFSKESEQEMTLLGEAIKINEELRK